MKLPPLQTDLRKLRFNNINTEPYRHLLWLAYWPVFGMLFYYAEHIYPVKSYNIMYHPLDSLIPFNEFFVIPYIFWFIYLIGIHIYTGLYDRDAFVKLMKYIVLTYSAGLIIFYLYPTCQTLRPAVMPRNNILCRFMTDFYNFDTSTNVCPSLHVIGSVAVMCTAFNTKGLQGNITKTLFAVITFLISISTVFLKQHSVIDIAAALVICAAAYPLCFKENEKRNHKKFISSRQ